MKIEKMNDNQIRCTLTKEDLASRDIRLTELAYGSDKAKLLFRDMMQQAFTEFGFVADDIPLMIEAVPVSRDSIVLIVTKVEDPEELDTRFSRFAPEGKNGMSDLVDAIGAALGDRADELLDLFHKNAASGETKPEEGDGKNARTVPAIPDVLIRIYRFDKLDDCIDACHILGSFYKGHSMLYKGNKTEGFFLKLDRRKSPIEEFNKACNILSEYGICDRTLSGSTEYLDEHFTVMIADDAVGKLKSV